MTILNLIKLKDEKNQINKQEIREKVIDTRSSNQSIILN